MQNIVLLAGNIGQDPETRSTQGGTKITHFTLATSRPRYSDGQVLRDEKGYGELLRQGSLDQPLPDRMRDRWGLRFRGAATPFRPRPSGVLVREC